MRFKKEIILIIIIIVGIIILEIFTDFISENAVKKISSELDTIYNKVAEAAELKESNELSNQYKEDMQNKIKEFKDLWYVEQDKLSMFFEHDELEKVTKSLVIFEENSKNEEYETSLENIAEFRYWLYHFKEKEKMKLKNFL